MMIKLMKRMTAVLAAAAAVLAMPALAVAQQFEKVEGAARQEIPAGRFVSLAYGFIWIAILVYVFFVARGLARVNKELAELQQKLNADTPVKKRAEA